MPLLGTLALYFQSVCVFVNIHIYLNARVVYNIVYGYNGFSFSNKVTEGDPKCGAKVPSKGSGFRWIIDFYLLDSSCFFSTKVALGC